MDFTTILKIGDSNIKEFIVKKEHTADFLGNKGVTVLSTPSMIYFMEAAAAQLVTGKLPENYRPVGTKIDVEHICSTAVDTKITVRATLTAVEGRKLRFKVEAFNERCIIGFGNYEQHIIDLDKFLDKNP